MRENKKKFVGEIFIFCIEIFVDFFNTFEFFQNFLTILKIPFSKNKIEAITVKLSVK